MQLILTWHKVADAGGHKFYTVHPSWFRAQLELVAAQGTPIVSLDALTDGSCALTFDDGTLDHYETVFPILHERGLRGAFFVPTGTIGQPGRLSHAQLRELSDAGHLIGCHSHDHLRLDRKTDAEIRDQLMTSLAILREATGREVTVFAPPGGFIDARVRRIARELGLARLRTMKWGLNHTLRSDALECIPLNRHLSPERFRGLLAGRGLASLRAVYWAKETIKRALPQEAYFRLRGWLAGRGPIAV